MVDTRHSKRLDASHASSSLALGTFNLNFVFTDKYFYKNYKGIICFVIIIVVIKPVLN